MPLTAGYVNGANWSALPPLGWATWCTDDFCGLLDLCFEQEIHDIADAMVANGMLKLGYKLILLGEQAVREHVHGIVIPRDIYTS